MNRERARELLPFIQAFADGEDIRIRNGNLENDDWTNGGEDIGFECTYFEFEIKLRPREFWIHPKGASTYIDYDPGSAAGFFKVREVIE